MDQGREDDPLTRGKPFADPIADFVHTIGFDRVAGRSGCKPASAKGDDKAGPIQYTQFKVISRAAVLADQLEAAIVEGALPPGSRLGTKEELRRRYDVAYGTLNEALRMLQERGYLTSRTGPGGGLFASLPDPTFRLTQMILGFHEGGTLADCAVVRHALELPIAIDAARSRTPQDVAELREILDRMVASRDDARNYVFENWRLHRRIAQICRNRVLGNLYRTLLDANEAEARETSPAPAFAESVDTNLVVHRQLVEGIALGSEDLARRAARAHQRLSRPARADRPVIPPRAPQVRGSKRQTAAMTT